MKSASERVQSEGRPRLQPEAGLVLLVRLEPWHRSFLGSLRSLVWPDRRPLKLVTAPAPFWSDVFVHRPLPWRRFLESAFYHGVALAALWGWSLIAPHRPRVEPAPLRREDVVTYSASEYLPPLDTGAVQAPRMQKGDPSFARQEIISVPPDADNRQQTIVTPPNIKIEHDVPLPNMVETSPVQPGVPLAATSRSASELKIPSLPAQAIAPAPELPKTNSARNQNLPSAVIEPPPNVQVSRARLGDLNIGPAQVVAPAPQLPVPEQRALSAASLTMDTASVPIVPPPPSMEGAGGGRVGKGPIIALSVNPVPPEAADPVPQGNRRGTFASGPQGRAGASGAPALNGSGRENGGGVGSGKPAGDAPPGLFVGAGSPETSAVAGHGAGNGTGGGKDGGIGEPRQVSPRLLASLPSTRVAPSRSPATESNPNATELERKVFGARKFYELTLNMPNLSSAGGSWVIHFAELKSDGEPGDLSAPVATRKVDPSYPNELMRQNVAGTVTLYAVIRRDGSVGSVRVLRGVDDQLDQYACQALSRWRFEPGTKNGAAVDLEAVVMIPFRPVRFKTGF